jgi:site-specific DNA recombinase
MDKFMRGQAPFGFRWQGGRLVLDEAEAVVRRRAVELFLNLKSMGAVARELNAAGHATRRGGKWTDVQAARILECPSAIGVYEINRSEEDESGRRRKTGKSVRTTVECEPIVTREVWEKVTALIQEKRAKRSPAEDEKAPLSGLVWCGCGQRMSMASKSSKFTCPKCSIQIAAADLEAVFGEDFGELVSSHPTLAGALETSSERRGWLAKVAEFEGELEGAARERAAAERMFAESAISKARFEELHAPLENQVRQLEGKLAGLRKKLASPTGQQGMAPELVWKTLWPTWVESRRRRIIVTFVSSFVVSENEVEIAYLLPEPSGSKETPKPQQTATPTIQSQTGGGPVYIRLPKPGEKCAITGLSRAKLNELILPNERNGFKPQVASKSLRQKGAQRGIRLVLLESLMMYLSGSV